MKDSRLIKILKTFSKSEMRSFEKFVLSPFYNTSEATSKLFGLIKNFYPDFNSRDFTKEKLYEGIYGKRKFSNELINKLVSNLIGLSLNYIAVSNNSLKQYNLLRGLRKKRLDGLFKSNFKNISKELEKKNVNEGDIIYQMLINMENSNYNLDADNYTEYNVSNFRFLELSTLYFFERLASNFIEKTNVASGTGGDHRKIINIINANIDYANIHKEIITSGLFHKNRLAHLLKMILLHNTRDDRYYNDIKASLFDVPLENTEVISLGYIYLLDHITYKIKSGDSSFLYERHQVYKKIERDFFASGSMKIIFTFFRNFILSGINCGDFEWARYILDKYLNDIEDKGNTGIEYYFDALISFHAGDFEGALAYISKLDLKKMVMDKFSMFFDIRFLKFKIYYELEYIEEALAMIDSFEHFLKKGNKLNKYIIPPYTSFIKIYKMLIMCRIKEDFPDAGKIRKKILSGRPQENKWLLKKAEELDNNFNK